MRILRTIAVAFAQYSRIPMPRFEWREEDVRCSIAVFPWVGAVIGMLWLAVYEFSVMLGLPAAAAALLMTAVPILITGGFHIDGFMDVCDAISSYGSREEKLAILKDPHIGAFAVIRLALCGLIYIASLIIIIPAGQVVMTAACGFFLARALSALSVLNFRSAKNEGMLYYEATAAAGNRRVNLIFTYIWIVAAVFLMTYIDLKAGLIETGIAILSFAWYKYRSYREFGGITGDTAGWFVVICETGITAGAAIAAVI